MDKAKPLDPDFEAFVNEIREAEKTRLQAEESDPEIQRKRRKEEVDLQAAYNRRAGRNLEEANRQEALIRDARDWLESVLCEAGSHDARLVLT